MTAQHRKPASWLLALIAISHLFILSGCHRVRYNETIGMLLTSGVVDPYSRQIGMRLVDSETEKPLEAVTVRILSTDAPLTLQTDATGRMDIPVHPGYLIENPWIQHDAGGSVKLVFSFTASMNTRDSTTRHVDVKGMSRAKNKQASILFPPGAMEKTRQTFTSLGKQYKLLAQTFEVRPVPWTVVLLTEKDEGVSYIVPQHAELPHAWAYSYAELNSGKFLRSNTHEWAEVTIENWLQLHDSDEMGRNRIIVDGLAEYAAFLAAGPDPKDAEQLRKFADAGTTVVDLTAEFRSIRMRSDDLEGPLIDEMRTFIKQRGFPAGYPLSFVFWYELNQTHGEDLPKRFLTRIHKEDNRDFENCIAVLEELTGEEDLAQRLLRADVSHAIEVLDSLADK